MANIYSLIIFIVFFFLTKISAEYLKAWFQI